MTILQRAVINTLYLDYLYMQASSHTDSLGVLILTHVTALVNYCKHNIGE